MKKAILTVVALILCGVIGFCGWNVYIQYKEDADLKAADSVIKELSPEEEQGSIVVAELQAQNPDVTGWLRIDGTAIDYPVLQAENNFYYLNRDVYKKRNIAGSVFMDYRCPRDMTWFNTIFYGHQNRTGIMFEAIRNYRDAAFYNQHTTGVYMTQDKTYKLQIFAFLIVDHKSPIYEAVFIDNESKQAHLDRIKKDAKWYTDVGIKPTDKIVTMSTCTYERKNARAVLIAKIL